MDVISYDPYWRLKNGLLASPPTLKADLRCDVVVLGGGISGALTADELVKAGLDVVLLERDDLASGSTSGSTGLLQYDVDVPLTELSERLGRERAERAYRRCFAGIDDLARLAGELGLGASFSRRPSLYLASTKRDAKGVEREAVARRAAGIEVDLLSERDLKARYPFSAPIALYSRQAAEVDPYRLTHALLARAVTRGLRVFDRSPVKGIKTHAKGVELRVGPGLRVRAGHLVIASGYESVKHLPHGLVDLNSTFAFASKPYADELWPGRALVWETARPYFYMRQSDDGRLIAGGADEEFRDPKRRDALIPEKTKALLRRSKRLLPAAELEAAYSWAGTFGETEDGLPYIGSLAKLPHCHFACGFGGNGIVFSAIAAQLLRAAILGQADADAEIFGFGRYS